MSPNYQIVENDVRLLRRILVALQLGDELSARTIAGHLRGKGLNFVLPGEQNDHMRKRYLARLIENEMYLAMTYGCIILPEYNDCIFLNSKWRNPYTLYVRLVEEEPALGDLGTKYWIPPQLGLEEEFRAQAEEAHRKYRELNPLPSPPASPLEPKSWYKRIFGG